MSKKTALQRLLNPASVAVIGGEAAAEVIRQCRRIGYAGTLLPVNPQRQDMEGLPCYASVADLPTTPDAGFIAIPPRATIDVVRELAARGTAAAVCYTSGFAEMSDAGAALQQELLQAAGDMAIVGPNCHGIVNYLDKVALWPDEHGGECTDHARMNSPTSSDSNPFSTCRRNAGLWDSCARDPLKGCSRDISISR